MPLLSRVSFGGGALLLVVAVAQFALIVTYELGYFGEHGRDGIGIGGTNVGGDFASFLQRGRRQASGSRRVDDSDSRIRRRDDGDRSPTNVTDPNAVQTPPPPFRLAFERMPSDPPEWIVEFLGTHGARRLDRAHVQHPDTKFIVMMCYGGDNCGGTTDRLKLLAYYAYLAQKSHRILLIRWMKPFPLEEFLVPPTNGYDWRVPLNDDGESLIAKEEKAYLSLPIRKRKDFQKARWHERLFEEPYVSERVVFANSNKAVNVCDTWFRKVTNGGEADDMAHLFRAFFEPSPPVAKMVEETVRKYGLRPGKYAAAHLRARFPRTTVKLVAKNKLHQKVAGNDAVDKPGGVDFADPIMREMVSSWAVNAVNCAMNLQPDAEAVYFASDTNDTVGYIMEESVFVKGEKFRVAAMDYSSEPLHLDYDKHMGMHPPSDFYSGYVDLWILAHAKCVAHGLGGYGDFVSKLTGNYEKCRMQHRNGWDTKMTICPPAVDGAEVNEEATAAGKARVLDDSEAPGEEEGEGKDEKKKD